VGPRTTRPVTCFLSLCFTPAAPFASLSFSIRARDLNVFSSDDRMDRQAARRATHVCKIADRSNSF
jgi:hypothetical protein